MRLIVRLVAASGFLTYASLANSAALFNEPVAAPPIGTALRPSVTPFEEPAPAMPWTGFSVGVNLGGAWGGADAAQIGILPFGSGPNPGIAQALTGPSIAQVLTGNLSSETGGFVGGAQVGYNYEFSNGLVLGVEADFQGLTGKSTVAQSGVGADIYVAGVSNIGSLNFSKQLDYLGTVRARAGYQVAPGILAYLTGGLAYGSANFREVSSVTQLSGLAPFSAFSAANYSSTLTGWTLGGGVEFPVWANLTAKIEYLYYDLGSISANRPFIGATSNPFTAQLLSQTNVRFDGSIARFGVNYHFNDFAPTIGPVIAKY